jgi:hypothetical protein
MVSPAICALCEVAMGYFPRHIFFSRPDLSISLRHTLQDYLTSRISLDTGRSILQSLIGNTDALERLSRILQTGPDPIPVAIAADARDLTRRKTRPWSTCEDERLLCGIYRFGIENWTSISKFVGNNRTRSQCSQRWYRGLNPAINKSPWTRDEDQRLAALVARLGDRSWTQIASRMGSRTDVQCRYRYKHMQREGFVPANEEEREGFPGAHPWRQGAEICGASQTATRRLLPPVSSLTASSGKRSQSLHEPAMPASQALGHHSRHFIPLNIPSKLQRGPQIFKTLSTIE